MFKKRFIISLIVACFTMSIYAQDAQNVSEGLKQASMAVRNQIIFSEINSLPADPNQVCIPDRQGLVDDQNGNIKVGVLLRNGDYGKYYKNKRLIGLSGNFWFFIPKEVKNKCISKRINNQKRLCQFFGLDTISRRDTIVFLRIDKSRLFRPAYNSNIATRVSSRPNEVRTITSSENKIVKWFQDQQRINLYPWTRMGYTYDWGDLNNHIGATEFVNRIGYFAEFDDYKTVTEFLNN